MDVEISQLATTTNSLRLGGKVIGPENSWVKFVQIVVPYDLFSYQILCEIQEHFEQRGSGDAGTLPLF